MLAEPPLPSPAPGRDVPDVLLPPPVIPLAMLVASVGLQRVRPLGWLAQVPPAWRIGAGACLMLAGWAVVVLGVVALKRRGTNVNPYRPSLAIETGGVFARTRNPIYVGGIVFTAGVAAAFGLDWLALLLPLGFAVLHFGVVKREERYLTRRFGDAYRAYQSQVRRYV